MPQVLVGPDRISTEIETGACAYDVVGDKARQVVVARVNGEPASAKERMFGALRRIAKPI